MGAKSTFTMGYYPHQPFQSKDSLKNDLDENYSYCFLHIIIIYNTYYIQIYNVYIYTKLL